MAGSAPSWQLFVLCSCFMCSCVMSNPSPLVKDTHPSYGAIAGDTRIFLVGENLLYIREIWLILPAEDVPLTINLTEPHSQIIDCRTPTNVSMDLLGETGTFLLLFDNSNETYNYTTPQTFTFKPNPNITGVTPAEAIKRGGIRQTIIGTDLDSVHPININMNMTLVYLNLGNELHFEQTDHHNEREQGLCSIANSTVMFCNSKPVTHTPIDPEWNPLNRPGHRFWLGFKMDGVTFYNYSEIIVYQNPELTMSEEVLSFKVYKGQTEIEIRGNNFNLGAAKEDYTILVGNGSTVDGAPSLCVITYFITNLIRCKPPTEPPHTGDIHKDGHPRITIEVGYQYEQVGYIRYEMTPWDDPVVRTTVIAVVCVTLAVIIIIVIAVVFIKRRRREEDQRPVVDDNGYTRTPGLWDRVPPDLKALLQPCLKDQDKLRLGRALGEGNFGSVHAAKFLEDDGRTVLVAAKTIKDSGVTPQQLREFLEEATMMRDFDHPHVLHLVGVVFKAGRPYVLLPYMENGDLRSYMLNQNNRFTVENLLRYCLEISWGMAYITRENFVHRDLAARNCMIGMDNTVKIADFGLAREVHQDDYYRVSDQNRPLPIKWMAIECLDDRKFTKYSDIWSYGVTVWEVLTRGKRPYSDVDNFNLKEYLMEGRRLDKPLAAPDVVYQLMVQCWDAVPTKRPSFELLASELDKVLHSQDDEEVDALPQETPEHPQRRQYQNLSRYVDTNTDIHKYQSILTCPVDSPPRPPEDDNQPAIIINYDDARDAFDSIPDSGYMNMNQGNGYLSPTSINNGAEYVAASGHDNNGYVSPDSEDNDSYAVAPAATVNTKPQQVQYQKGYDNLEAIRQHEQNKKTPVKSDDNYVNELP